jgi:hypothetical protein
MTQTIHHIDDTRHSGQLMSSSPTKSKSKSLFGKTLGLLSITLLYLIITIITISSCYGVYGQTVTTELSPGWPVTGVVVEGEYNYYKVNILNGNGKILTTTITPFGAGDPDSTLPTHTHPHSISLPHFISPI